MEMKLGDEQGDIARIKIIKMEIDMVGNCSTPAGEGKSTVAVGLLKHLIRDIIQLTTFEKTAI